MRAGQGRQAMPGAANDDELVEAAAMAQCDHGGRRSCYSGGRRISLGMEAPAPGTGGGKDRGGTDSDRRAGRPQRRGREGIAWLALRAAAGLGAVGELRASGVKAMPRPLAVILRAEREDAGPVGAERETMMGQRGQRWPRATAGGRDQRTGDRVRSTAGSPRVDRIPHPTAAAPPLDALDLPSPAAPLAAASPRLEAAWLGQEGNGGAWPCGRLTCGGGGSVGGHVAHDRMRGS